MIQEEVEKILQSKDRSDHIALAFIDLDNFKHINDYYSHSIGDALLVKLPAAWRATFVSRTCWRGSAVTNLCCW